MYSLYNTVSVIQLYLYSILAESSDRSGYMNANFAMLGFLIFGLILTIIFQFIKSGTKDEDIKTLKKLYEKNKNLNYNQNSN